MASYNKKVVVSGNIIELYEYEKDVIFGYTDTKKKTKGRQATANAEDKEKNREKVLSRARKDLRRIINSNIQKYSKFLTLTFKENITDLDFANNEFKKFIKRLNYHYGIKIKYSTVIEFQERGAIHYHCILYNLTQKVDVKELQGIWKQGFIKINAIDSVDNVGAYVCKYMTKTDDDRLLGRKMYFNSRGLNKPQEIKELEVVDALVGSLQQQTLTYENTFSNEHNSVIYKQYNILPKEKKQVINHKELFAHIKVQYITLRF